MRKKFKQDGGLANNKGKVQKLKASHRKLAIKQKSLRRRGELSQRGICFTGKRGGYPKSDEDCSCRRNKSCRKTEIPRSKFSLDGNGVLNKAGKTVHSAASDLYNGNDEARGISDASLKKQAANIRGLRRKVERLANFNLKKQGKKPINFKKLERGVGAKLNRLLTSSYKRLTPDEKRSLATAVPALMSNPLEKNPASKEELSSEQSVSSVQLSGGSGNRRPATPNMDMSLFEDEGEEGRELASEEVELLNAEELKEIGEVDTVYKDQGVPLWRVLSHRYLRQYPKLLKKAN